MQPSSDSSLLELPEPAHADIWEHSLSAGGSLLVHLALLGLLAAMTFTRAGSGLGRSLEGEFLDTAVAQAISPEPLPLIRVDGTGGEPGGSSPAEPVALTEIASSPVDISTPADVAESLALADVGIPVGGLAQKLEVGKPGKAQHAGKGGKGTGTGTGEGDGAGTGGGGSGRGKGFFGITKKGTSTVFVVDASRSMLAPHPGPALTRFNRVKLELLRAISELNAEEKFFIIFFNDGAIPMPADRMIEADRVAIRRYLGWMMQVQTAPVTNPNQALQLALNLQPDTIYFLTDGWFDYSVVPNVTAANVNHVTIHTIGFGDDGGEPLLREIAANNGGRYRFISAEESAAAAEEAGATAAAILSQLGK